ncbi:MAG TPA: glycosyltransferase family 39 protein [Patescibacteria group bacterium]
MSKIPSFFQKPIILLLLPLVIYFYFGLQHIAKFETADEHYWMYSNSTVSSYWNYNNGRIAQYWQGIMTGNLKLTRINDKPGVTLAYVSGIGSYLQDKLDAKLYSGVIAPFSKTEKAELINLFYRIPLLAFNGFFVFVLYLLIKKLTRSSFVSLAASTLMLLSPILIGISQIVNPDSLLWNFAFASILSFLIFLKEQKNPFVHLSGIFLGLSLLTKYSSVILIPFLLLVALAFFVDKGVFTDLNSKIKYVAWRYFLIVFEALAIYAILMPDNLIEFDNFLKGSVGFKGAGPLFFAVFFLNGLLLFDAYFFESALTKSAINSFSKMQGYLSKSLFVILPVITGLILANTALFGDTFKLFVIPFDASTKQFFANGITWRLIFRQLTPFIFSISPLVLLFAIYGWILNVKKKTENNWLVLVFSLFLVVFVAGVTVEKVPLTIRYSIMLYPGIMLLAALGMAESFRLENMRKFKSKLLFLLIMIFSIVSLHGIKPFYFNYANSMLPKKYVITDSWGYGGFEAAQYLNSLPNAKNVRIWSDYNGVCLFYEGDCAANMLTMQNILKKNSDTPNFAYFVSDRRGNNLSHEVWKDLREKYDSKLVWDMAIGGRKENYIKVYANK